MYWVEAALRRLLLRAQRGSTIAVIAPTQDKGRGIQAIKALYPWLAKNFPGHKLRLIQHDQQRTYFLIVVVRRQKWGSITKIRRAVKEVGFPATSKPLSRLDPHLMTALRRTMRDNHGRDLALS